MSIYIDDEKDIQNGGISVVIPTYNRGHTIEESIRSVLNQTLQPKEIIVVDDFSTDNTEEIIKKINDPNVIYVKNKMSKGANGARNTGILLATEKFIAFHDSDDIWFPEKLKYQMRTMIEKSCDLVFCNMVCGKFIVPQTTVDGDNIYDQLKAGNLISTQTILIRAEIAKLNLFDEELMRLQDWDFVLSLLYKKIKIGYCDKVLVEQRLSTDSITNKNKLLDAYKHILKKHPEIANKGYNNKIYSLSLAEQKTIKSQIELLILKLFRKFKSKNKRLYES